MTSQPKYAKQLESKTGQSKSPTVELDGEFLPDASVEDLAEALEKRGIVL